jgi:putative Holliday junction resolvase
VKILALDYGAARTGVAVSDPSGTIARPLGVVERAASEAGLARLAELVRSEGAECVVVGLPLTLRGEHGEQARETQAFVEALKATVDVPVESYDERFTTRLARGDDARAAAHLLSSYLEWSSAGRE